MQDFALEQGNDSQFDLVIDEQNKVYSSVDGMETAINFQLFVDQRVSKEERANPQDRRGWIGDLMTRQINYQVGSLLHLKEQSRDTQENRNEIAALAKDSLDYFVALGASKEVTARVVGSNIEGTILSDINEISRYSKLWKGTVTDGV